MIIRFLRNFDFQVKTNVVIAYKKDHQLRVPRHHAEAALQAGAAVQIRTPPVRRRTAP